MSRRTDTPGRIFFTFFTGETTLPVFAFLYNELIKKKDQPGIGRSAKICSPGSQIHLFLGETLLNGQARTFFTDLPPL